MKFDITPRESNVEGYYEMRINGGDMILVQPFILYIDQIVELRDRLNGVIDGWNEAHKRIGKLSGDFYPVTNKILMKKVNEIIEEINKRKGG